MNLLQLVVDSLSTGAIYMMLALGISVVFSVMGLVNFAYGMMIVWFGLILHLLASLALPYWLSLTLTLISSILLSMLLARAVFLQFVGAPPAALLLASFGIAIVLQSIAIAIFGEAPRVVPTPGLLQQSLDWVVVRVSVLQLFAIGLGLMLLIALEFLIGRTRIGMEIRAVAESPETARMMAVRSDRVLLFVFAISGLIAGLVSFIWFAQLGSVTPRGDLNPTLKAFIAVVIGGLGTIRGAVLGGLALGILETTMLDLIGASLSVYQQTFVFVLVILILLLRPQGIAGRSFGDTR